MKSFLILAVWVTLVGADEESLRQQLLRVLTEIEKRAQPQNTSPTTPISPPPSASSSQQQILSTETVTYLKTSIKEISFKEFSKTVQEWIETSNQFSEQVEQIKPMVRSTLTRTAVWEVVAQKLDSIFEQSSKVYEQILDDALDIGHRLYVSKVTEGFGTSGRCKSMEILADTFNPVTDPYAEVNLIQSLISDLDCFSKEFQDITSSLDDSCLIENKLGVDTALGMIGNVMKFLYRWKSDGEQFKQAAMSMESKVQQMYEKMNFSPKSNEEIIIKDGLKPAR